MSLKILRQLRPKMHYFIHFPHQMPKINHVYGMTGQCSSISYRQPIDTAQQTSQSVVGDCYDEVRGILMFPSLGLSLLVLEWQFIKATTSWILDCSKHTNQGNMLAKEIELSSHTHTRTHTLLLCGVQICYSSASNIIAALECRF